MLRCCCAVNYNNLCNQKLLWIMSSEKSSIKFFHTLKRYLSWRDIKLAQPGFTLKELRSYILPVMVIVYDHHLLQYGFAKVRISYLLFWEISFSSFCFLCVLCLLRIFSESYFYILQNLYNHCLQKCHLAISDVASQKSYYINLVLTHVSKKTCFDRDLEFVFFINRL